MTNKKGRPKEFPPQEEVYRIMMARSRQLEGGCTCAAQHEENNKQCHMNIKNEWVKS